MNMFFWQSDHNKERAILTKLLCSTSIALTLIKELTDCNMYAHELQILMLINLTQFEAYYVQLHTY